MRVSERQRYNVTTDRVERAKTSNSKMLEKMSTQKRISRLSDDPVGMGQAIREKDRIARQNQYQKNVLFAQGFIERTESAISGIADFLIRAKELAVQQANATYGAAGRKSTSMEVRQIMDGVIALANTSYGNRYVFAGYRALTPPLTLDGQYVGDDGAVFLPIDEGNFRQINIQPRYLFENSEEEKVAGHFPLVHTLSILHEGLQTNDVHMIRKSMEELEFQLGKVNTYQAKLGAIHSSLSGSLERLELGEELSMESLSKIEDADMFRTTSDFKRTETVLQSTLMASNKLLQPSLLNFLQ